MSKVVTFRTDREQRYTLNLQQSQRKFEGQKQSQTHASLQQYKLIR